MKKTLLFLLFFLFISGAKAQYRFKHVGIAQGLSQNSVHCIFRDSDGFIWIGTQDGLNLYDGNSFVSYRHTNTDSTSLSDDFVLNITEDSHKNLWIGTRNGENRFDKKTGIFQRIFSRGMDKKFFHNSVHIGFADSTGNIIFTSGDSMALAKINPITGNFTIDILPIPFSAASYLCHDKAGNLFYMDEEGLFRFDNHQGLLSSPKLLSKKINRTNHPNPFCFLSKQGILWLCENDQLTLFNAAGDSIKTDMLNNNHILVAEEDLQGNVWLGGRNGITLLNSNGAMLAHLINTPSDESGLKENTIISLYTDPNGLIWIGYVDKGFSIYNPNQEVFRSLRKNNSSPISLKDNSIWAIYQSKKTIWLGSSTGLQQFKLKSEKFSDEKGMNNILEAVAMSSGKDDILNRQINSINRDDDGAIWIGTRGKGIAKLDTNGKILNVFNTENSALCSNTVFHLLFASDKTLWISTISGLNRLNLASGKMNVYTTGNSKNNSIPANYVISTFEDSKKRIWISTTMGLSVYTPSIGKFKSFTSDYSNPKSLSYSMVTTCMEDKAGRIWVTTLGGGVNLYDESDQSFKNFSTHEGLANNVIYGILQDEKGDLWMSSDKGISMLDMKNKNFTNFNTNDGLVANEFCQNAFFKNSSGELLWGTPEGFMLFNPVEIRKPASQIPVRLTGVSLNYLKINPYQVSEKNAITLHHQDKTVSFEFTGLDYFNAAEIQYSFMLEGFDNTWNICNSGQRIASYTNLPYGDFVFRVRVMKNTREWSTPLLNIQVHVIPPFWKTWWFLSITGVLLLLLLFAIINYFTQLKLKRKIREIEIQNKIQKERERISMDLHDNVGAHLTYITHSLDHISHKIKKGEPTVSEEKISDLSDFSRDVMQQLRETIWAINKEVISVEDLLNKIEEHLIKQLSGTEHIGFRIENLTKINRDLKPSLAIHLFRVTQEALTNCMKHSGAKNIFIQLSEDNSSRLILSIRDDGKGMNTQVSPDGHFGISNMNARVKEVGGSLHIQSKEGNGTTIQIIFPV